MSKQLIVNMLLALAVASASLPDNLTLLAAISTNGTLDVLEMRALSCIASSHPELADYMVTEIYDGSAPNSTESDYFVTLRSGSAAILAAVSFHANHNNFFVSFTRLPTASNSDPSPLNSNNQSSQVNDSSEMDNQQPQLPPRNTINPIPPPNSQTGARVLGGYQMLPILADAKLNIAQSYLLQLHPNLINYKLQYVEYQVTTGINYLLFYSGVDKITNLTAKVYVNLNGVAYLTAFEVTCAVTSPSCNSNIAGNIFHGTEQVLTIHPELLSYGLVAIDIQESSSNSLVFMATFQNELLKMRAIAEVKIGKSTEVLSFYSYLYS